MAGQRGTQHARHRTQSVSVGPAIAVDCDPRDPIRHRVAHGCIHSAPRGCGTGVSTMYPINCRCTITPRNGSGGIWIAAGSSTTWTRVSHKWNAVNTGCARQGAVDGPAGVVHAAVCALRHRCAEPMRRQRRHANLVDQLRRGVRLIPRAATHSRARKQVRIV